MIPKIILRVLLYMTDSDFNSDSTSYNPIASLNSRVLDHVREHRTKSRHDCSTSNRINEEPTIRLPSYCYNDTWERHMGAYLWPI